MTPGGNDVLLLHAIPGLSRAALMDTSKPGAVFMKIVNVGVVSDRLVSIETPVAMMAQPHKEKIKGDKMKMRQKRALFISASRPSN